MNVVKTDLPNQERKMILTYLYQEAVGPKPLSVAAVASTMKNRMGIDWKKYNNESGSGFPQWLCRNFPVEIVPEENRVRLLFPTVSEYCADIVVKAMGKNRSILKSQIPAILESRGVKWQEHAGGKKLGDWLTDNFAYFKDSEDNYSIYLRGDVPQIEEETEAEYDYPIVLDVAEEDLEEEIRQMHSFAFMGWWNNNTRKLRQYTGYKGNEEGIWRAIVAHQMAEAFVGVQPTLLDASGDEDPRIAFDTGMTTVAGEKLYCVFSLNPRNVNGTMQPWILLGFCYPNEEDEDGLGKWLAKRFDIEPDGESVPQNDYLLLKEKLEELKANQNILLASLDDCVKAVMGGRPLQDCGIGEDIVKYHTLWGEMDKLLSSIGWDVKEEEKSVELLLERIEKQDTDAERLQKAVCIFTAMAEGVQNLLDSYHISTGDIAVTKEDTHRIQELYGGAIAVENNSVFLEILSYYKALYQVMSAAALSEEVEFAIEKVCQHFAGLTYKAVSRLLVNSDAQECEMFAGIGEIERALAKRKASAQGNDNGTKGEVSVEELLDAATAAGYQKTWNVYTVSLEPGDEEEKQIVNNGMEAQENLPKAYTPYAVGVRLNAAVGNSNQTAEKFFLLGLCRKDYRCVTALLDMYRKEERKEEFGKIWEGFAKYVEVNIENQLYMLSSKDSYEELQEYLESRPYLFYIKETLSVIISAYRQKGLNEKAERLETRLAQLKAIPELNAFEQTLVSGDVTAISAWADKKDVLDKMGYTEKEIKQITHTLANENFGKGTADYEIGVRLLTFQGNKSNMAEQYLWRGLAEGSWGGRCVELMGILVSDGRWQECCDLYQAYSDGLSAEGKSRQYYMLALLHTEPKAAMDFIHDNLQDYLILEQGAAEVRALVEALIQSEERSVAEFYQEITNISELLSDDFTRSVVLLDRRLRDFVTQQERLEELLLTPEQAEKSIAIYKTDAYPQGGDAVSIAQRVYAFVGTFGGIAESIAKFALPDYNAVTLLWEIYELLEEKEEQYRLLQDYPMLRETHWEIYGVFLFEREQYAQLEELCRNKEDLSTLLQILKFIACLKTKQGQTIILPELGLELIKLDVKWVILLLKELAAVNRLEDVKQILFGYFDDMLYCYDGDSLRRVAWADGALSKEVLLDIQRAAVEKGWESLAVYYYNELGLGDIAQLAEEYYREELAECEAADESEKVAVLHKLQVLYQDKAAGLDGKLSLLKISRSLKDGIDLKQDAREIAGILKQAELKAPDVKELLSMLQGEAAARNPFVYPLLAELCEQNDLEKEGLAFFHSLALNNLPMEEEFGDFLCTIYVKALLGGYMPEEMLQDALSLCHTQLEKNRNVMATFCIYRMEQMCGNKHRAEFALHFLAKQRETIGKDFYQIVDNEMKSYWEEGLPGFLELFRMMLNESKVDEVKDYCRYCHDFIGDDVQTKLPELLEEKSLLSEKESEEVLKLLYSDYENSTYWDLCTKLPLQNDPVAYTKLLYVVSTHKKELWKECVTYCEKYKQSDLLLQAFIGWSEGTNTASTLKECRTYLEERIEENGEYLKQWKEREQEVLRLVEKHCSVERSSLYETEMHAALRAVVVIAVSCGIPEALTMLYEKQGQYLFGEHCNLSMVAVCHLLLDGRIEEAHSLIQKLDKIVFVMKYRVLIDRLADMTVTQLREWVEDGTENRNLLKLVLPDGNAPDLARIQKFVLESIQEGSMKSAAAVLCRLLEVFPKDYGCYDSLFALCKTDFEGRMVLLHRSIRNLIGCSPIRSAETYYRRTKAEYAAMLAALNAVLLSAGREDEITGYDFSKKAGDFCRDVMTLRMSYDEVNSLNQIQDDVSRLLANRSAEEYAKMSSVILCLVTGEWSEFLRTFWRKNADVGEALALTLEKGEIRVNDRGFLRGILQVLHTLSEEERKSFIGWLDRALASEECEESRNKRRQMKIVHFVADNCLLEKINNPEVLQQILKYPIEEYSMFGHCYETYILDALNEDYDQVYARALVIGALADYYMVQKLFWQTAKEHFEKSKDEMAAPLFGAMHDLARRFGILHTNNTKPRARQSVQEQYEIYYRLTRLFSGDEEVQRKIASPEFNSWSCVNMAMGLLYSVRANEVERYSRYLAEDNKHLIDGLLKGIDERVADEDKIAIVRSQADDMSKAILAYIFKCLNFRTGEYFFLKKAGAAEILNDIYLEMEEKRPNEFSNHCIRHFLWVEPIKINAKVHERPRTDENRAMEVKQEMPEEVTEMRIPFFARDLEPLHENVDLRKLWEEYDRMPTISAEHYRQRERKAEQLYRVMMAGNMSAAEKIDILTRFGVDYYYAHAVGDADEIRLANQALKEIVMLQRHSEEGVKGRALLELMVRTTALHELLHKGYETLKGLLEDYSLYRSAFKQMQKMLRDSVVVDSVQKIYQVIDALTRSYSTVAESDTASIRKALQDAYSGLEDIGNQSWYDVKDVLQMLIRKELNGLEERPILKIEVLNEGPGKENGYLYGQICNIGRVAAKNIVLQAHYDAGATSRQYVLDYIEPSDTAVFEVDYSVAPGTTILEYSVTVTYTDQQKKICNSGTDKKSLVIDESQKPTFPADLYDTDTVADFEADEDGNIVSPNFFGRSEETEKLRGLFRGNKFVNYHSAILYGTRRVGKTSLLNYIKKYTEYHCPNAVTIYVSCQGISDDNCIQYVFIDKVFEQLEQWDEELKKSAAWEEFVADWKLPEGSKQDRDPNKLELFYRGLRKVLGKGLIFLIDEIDTLFTHLAEKKNKQLDSTLFPALSTILCSADCRESVQFILCGSKWLLRYRKGDGELSQLFQRLGDRVTEVGRMPEKDMVEMLCAPCKKYPELKYTDAALNCIWDYTGGLVWHTKLLGQRVIKRIRAEGRCVVYPFDIRAEIMGITRDGQCQQFYDGFDAREDKKELLVLDAMQSLANKQGRYISVDEIYDLLDDYIVRQEITRQEIDRALSMLCSLTLIERHLAGQPRYRFTVDIYRVYFRVQEIHKSVFEKMKETDRVFQCKDEGENLVSDSSLWGF